MNEEDIQLKKLLMALHASESLDHEESDDFEDSTDFMADLKDAAWDLLHENPGMDYDEWEETLIAQYPSEVVDALGTDPAEAYAALADLWDSNDYEDKATGECFTFQQWAECFATDLSVEIYDRYAEAKTELNHTKNVHKQILSIINN